MLAAGRGRLRGTNLIIIITVVYHRRGSIIIVIAVVVTVCDRGHGCATQFAVAVTFNKKRQPVIIKVSNRAQGTDYRAIVNSGRVGRSAASSGGPPDAQVVLASS